jgi:hypothetical protein
VINRFIPLSDDSRTRKSGSNRSAKLRAIPYIIDFETAQPFGPLGKAISKASPVTSAVAIDSGSLRRAIQQWLVAFSRLPVDSVLFEVGVDGAPNRRIEVGGTEAIE